MIHISDLRETGQYGVMGTLALVISKKVASVGSTSEKKKLRQWLEEATAERRLLSREHRREGITQ